MEEEQTNKGIETCLAPFKRAQRLLVEAENRMSEMGYFKPGEKSEIRVRFEEFEENLNNAWKQAFKDYGVTHVFDLPVPVYRQICEDYIHRPGGELLRWLSGKAVGCRELLPKENPYVMAGAALGLSYNLAPDTSEDKQ